MVQFQESPSIRCKCLFPPPSHGKRHVNVSVSNIGRPFKAPRFTLHQWTMSTFHLFHSKRDKKTPNSTKPTARAWEEFHCGKSMTFPAGKTFTPDLNTTPCQLHFPANSSPEWERDWASDRWWWQTTAACGVSVQERHSSSKGHSSQSGYTKSKRVQAICDPWSEEHSSREWALGDMKALGHCGVKHSARLLLIIKKNQNKLTMPWEIDCWLDSKHLPILLPQSLQVCLEQRAELMHSHYAETHCNLISYLAKTSADS